MPGDQVYGWRKGAGAEGAPAESMSEMHMVASRTSWRRSSAQMEMTVGEGEVAVG